MQQQQIASPPIIYIPTDQVPTAQWVTVTPELAAHWIETANIGNRPLHENDVEKWAADMSSGKWRGRNGESIKFDTDGRMFEGQHRCYACVRSGVPFDTLLITGCDPEDYSTSGIGRPKSIADFLGPVHHEKNVHLLAAVLRLVHLWSHGKLTGKEAVSIPELEDALRDHPNVRDSVALFSSHPARKLLAASYCCLIHYAGTLENHSALVSSFFDRLGSGLGLFDDDPVYQLRKFLLSQKQAKPGTRRAGRIYVLALAIKAWNASKEERKVKVLSFRVDEGFPQL